MYFLSQRHLRSRLRRILRQKEEVRLKYRYLDLRRPDMQRNLMMRSKVANSARQFMANEGFLEIETPVLIGSTPEGARDYLVPSQRSSGTFLCTSTVTTAI